MLFRSNAAAHQLDHAIGYREGLEALKVARELAVWFHRTFGSAPDFKPGPFVLPDDPSQRLVDLQREADDCCRHQPPPMRCTLLRCRCRTDENRHHCCRERPRSCPLEPQLESGGSINGCHTVSVSRNGQPPAEHP